MYYNKKRFFTCTRVIILFVAILFITSSCATKTEKFTHHEGCAAIAQEIYQKGKSKIFYADCLFYSINNRTFAEWIGESCKLPDKGKLTTLPRFTLCQRNLLNVSKMLKHEELPVVNSERWLSITDLEGEVWKDVVGYEGLYQVSNYGRIKSLNRVQVRKNGSKILVKCRILKYHKQYYKNCFYYSVSLHAQKLKTWNVHRIVALTFVENKDNKPYVDHINGQKEDNRCVNLRWATCLENIHNPITYDIFINKMSERRNKKSGKDVIPVNQYTIDGILVSSYPSINEASRVTGIDATAISYASRNKKYKRKDGRCVTVKTAGGYLWAINNKGNDDERSRQI